MTGLSPSRIRRRATAILRARVDKSACLGMAERNDVGPKGDQCHHSRCRPREHEIHKIETDDPSWATQEGQLLIPASNLDVDGYFCPGSGGRTYPH